MCVHGCQMTHKSYTCHYTSKLQWIMLLFQTPKAFYRHVYWHPDIRHTWLVTVLLTYMSQADKNLFHIYVTDSSDDQPIWPMCHTYVGDWEIAQYKARHAKSTKWHGPTCMTHAGHTYVTHMWPPSFFVRACTFLHPGLDLILSKGLTLFAVALLLSNWES